MISGQTTRPRLQTQLLLLLLLFGVVPVVIVTTFGYSVSRTAIIDQSQSALRELANRQATYLRTEIRREQLILRTIAGQVAPVMSGGGDVDLQALLAGGLADDGVFDGLRVVGPDGRVLADVALREIDPNWPEEGHDRAAPGLSLHLAGDSVVAYLLTVPLLAAGRPHWLQGHVRSQDFPRNLDVPIHLLGGVELGVFDHAGHAIIVSHAHATSGLQGVLAAVSPGLDEVARIDLEGRRALGFTASLPQLRWTLVAALPLSIVLAPVNNLLVFAVVGGTALVLLIFAAGHLASRYVTTPLRELSAAASTLGETGSYGEIEHSGVAETQTLIDSFHDMAENLQRTRDEVADLHGRELERAQQLATVGELASGVAHEIRNPLTGVIGALEVVRRKMNGGDESLRLIDEARAQLHRIESTTTQLLEYARPPELRLIDVDLVGVVERAMRIVQSTAEKAGVTLRVTSTGKPHHVRADPELMVQVMVNLLLNGIEVSPESGEITIQLDRSGQTFRVRVSDHGPGVPEGLRRNIFRPFFTTKHQGTGLGLSISQQIVARHDGSLRVEDTPGGGATFVMELPETQET